MARREIGTDWSNDSRNNMNHNFKELYTESDTLKNLAQQLINGSFDEAELTTEIENKLNQLEQDYAPKLASLETEIEDARGDESSLGDRLNEFSSQLAETPTSSNILAPTSKLRVIGHRGFSSGAPENTLPAYELAKRVGHWGGETDTQVTSDGVWVIMHDDTVDRTTDGTGTVASMSLAQIKELTVDYGRNIEKYPNLKVPTLEEFLDLCKKINLVPVIEIKNAYYTEANYNEFMRIISERDLESRCVVISSSKDICQEIRERSRKIYIQLVTGDIIQEDLDFLFNLTNAGIDALRSEVTKEKIKMAHDMGILVNAYTPGTLEELYNFVSWGIDFITTNNLVWRD